MSVSGSALGGAEENAAVSLDLRHHAGLFAFHFQPVKCAEIEPLAKLRGFLGEKFKKADAVGIVRALPFVKDFAFVGTDHQFIDSGGVIAAGSRDKRAGR